MLVSHMSGLGDVTSSLAHRKNKVTASHVVTAANRPAAAAAQAKAAAIVADPMAYVGVLHGRHREDQIARRVAAKIQSLAPTHSIRTKAGAVTPGPGTTSPLALFLNKAATAATASPAAAAAAAATAPAVTTSALTTTAPTITPGGGGGGGGGGDTSPTDTTDATTADAPTGWAALSPTMKVAIVGGGAVVAYIGYRAMRRR